MYFMVSFPDYKPAYSAQRTDISPVIPFQFGDGYEQRFSFGFALTPQEWDLTFIGSDAEIDEIDAFLGVRALDRELFEWTTPENNSDYGWICKEWKKEKFDYNASRLTARFQQRIAANAANRSFAWARQYALGPGVTASETSYGIFNNILSDRKGNIYYILRVSVNSVFSLVAIKINKKGNIVWSKHLNRVAGFGNSVNIDYGSDWFSRVGPQGLILVAGQSANQSSAARNKIICLDVSTGSLKWAKALSSGSEKPFNGVHVNASTGQTYIVSGTNDGWNVVTLDSSGNVIKNISFNIFGCIVRSLGNSITLADGSIAFIGSYIRPGAYYWDPGFSGSFYIVLNADGSIRQALKTIGDSTASAFQGIKPGAIRKNGNVLLLAGAGVIEFNSSMTTVASLHLQAQGGGSVHVNERPDGTIALLTNPGISSIPGFGYNYSSWCAAGLVVLNSDMTQVVAEKNMGIGQDTYNSPYLDGRFGNLISCVPPNDRYVFMVKNSKTIVSIDPGVNSWITQVNGPGQLQVATRTTDLPRNTSSDTFPAIANANQSSSTLSTAIQNDDYRSSVTIEDFTQITWTLYSQP